MLLTFTTTHSPATDLGFLLHKHPDRHKLVVAHAGMKEDMQGRGSGAVRSFALYGETMGEVDDRSALACRPPCRCRKPASARACSSIRTKRSAISRAPGSARS